jgi:hypothetical protein
VGDVYAGVPSRMGVCVQCVRTVIGSIDYQPQQLRHVECRTPRGLRAPTPVATTLDVQFVSCLVVQRCAEFKLVSGSQYV